MIKIIAGLVLATAIFTGCTKSTIQISKCKSYKDNVCVVKDLKTVKLCRDPKNIEGKTYCTEK